MPSLILGRYTQMGVSNNIKDLYDLDSVAQIGTHMQQQHLKVNK